MVPTPVFFHEHGELENRKGRATDTTGNLAELPGFCQHKMYQMFLDSSDWEPTMGAERMGNLNLHNRKG